MVSANKTKLEILEAELGEGPFFNGADFSLVDAAYAPFFVRLGLIDRQLPVFDREALPKVAQWSDRLLALPSVINSVVPEFPELYEALIWKRQGYLAHNIQGAVERTPVQGGALLNCPHDSNVRTQRRSPRVAWSNEFRGGASGAKGSWWLELTTQPDVCIGGHITTRSTARGGKLPLRSIFPGASSGTLCCKQPMTVYSSYD